jgi:phage baseplate assembly protein W
MSYMDLPYDVAGNGFTATTSERARRVRNLLEAVLFTAPGERVMRPDFGSGVPEMLFDGNSEALDTAADFLIRSAVQRYLSDVLVLTDLSVSRHEGELHITVVYSLIGEDEQQTETFSRGAA